MTTNRICAENSVLYNFYKKSKAYCSASSSESIFEHNNKLHDIAKIGGIALASGIGLFLGVKTRGKILKANKNKKLFKIAKVHEVEAKCGDILFGELSAAQKVPVSIKSFEPKVAGYNMTQAEKNFYEDIFENSKKIFPEKSKCNPYINAEETIMPFLNGDKIEKTNYLDKYLHETGNFVIAAKSSNDGNFILNSKYNNGCKLLTDYEEFCGTFTPNEENLAEFIKHRNLNYIRENGIGLKELQEVQTSIRKGEEIAKAEKMYHDSRQAMYSSLWKPYHTEQFYRIIGEDELIKMLRGEEIVSTNSLARYGRNCVDITSNGYYHDILYGEQKFRIPFKRKDATGHWNIDFTSEIYDFRPEKSHYQIPSYSIKDVDIKNITYWDKNDWQPIDLSAL
ncbi:MAG: hypothetical protein MJ237_03130 [bacterium]|nr:hypothetical protein [bacterium]